MSEKKREHAFVGGTIRPEPAPEKVPNAVEMFALGLYVCSLPPRQP